MRVVAHEAFLARKNEDGVTKRAELEASAKNGKPLARERLVLPDIPEDVEYLLDWSKALVGRSGVGGMGGIAPLTWECLRAWSAVTGNVVTQAEASALMLLDGALREPDDYLEGSD